MTTLAGRVSVRLVCVSALFGSVLTKLMVSTLFAPAQMVFALKFLFTEGGKTVVTCRVALAGVVFATKFPRLSVAVEPPAGMVLMRLPAVVDVISTATVQDPFVLTLAGTVPPLKEMLVPPATALTEPPQSLDRFTGLARLIPGWTLTRLSLHASLMSWNMLGL